MGRFFTGGIGAALVALAIPQLLAAERVGHDDESSMAPLGAARGERPTASTTMPATIASASPEPPVSDMALATRRVRRRPARPPSYPAGAHPYPRGDEWPAGLTGPFARQPPFHVRVRSFDGVELDGWVQLPALPPGVRAPVVLVSSPYYGHTGPTGDVDEVNTPRHLVDHGYAVAAFSVRGTGRSGGCFDLFGPDEQRDQPVLVEWLAAQPWSSGRVGMYGLSYQGTTPWEAAIQNPPHLKTIVVAGMVADVYNFFHTPQGAAFTVGPAFGAALAGLVGVGPPTVVPAPLGPLVLRACPQVAGMLATLAQGNVSDQRDPAFWRARRLADHFSGIGAAVLLTHGFQDLWGSGHAFQEDYVWRALRGPKAMIEGQWGHTFPDHDGWSQTLLGWFDFWLKGIGSPPARLGRAVDYQDGAGGWHRSDAWPPPEARAEVLHLADRGLRPTPEHGWRSFLAAPPEPAMVAGPGGPESLAPRVPLCIADVPGLPARALLYEAAAARQPVVLAGNPLALLRLRTTQPGGMVALHLVDLSPDFVCRGSGASGGFRLLTFGAVDLRFHRGDYIGTDFPVGTETEVRVNLASLAEVLEPGHRLAVVVSSGDPLDRTGRVWTPLVEVLPGSQVVVPVLAGTVGGAPPSRAYPPNPFPGSVGP